MSSGLTATFLASALLHLLGFTALSMVGGSLWSPVPPANVIPMELRVEPPPPAVSEPVAESEPDPEPPQRCGAIRTSGCPSTSGTSAGASDPSEIGEDHTAKTGGETPARARRAACQNTASSLAGTTERVYPVPASWNAARYRDTGTSTAWPDPAGRRPRGCRQCPGAVSRATA